MSEQLLSRSTDLMIGKKISGIDARACNNILFRFTDGSKVVLHIECDHLGLPSVLTCTHCADDEPEEA